MDAELTEKSTFSSQKHGPVELTDNPDVDSNCPAFAAFKKTSFIEPIKDYSEPSLEL